MANISYTDEYEITHATMNDKREITCKFKHRTGEINWSYSYKSWDQTTNDTGTFVPINKKWCQLPMLLPAPTGITGKLNDAVRYIDYHGNPFPTAHNSPVLISDEV